MSAPPDPFAAVRDRETKAHAKIGRPPSPICGLCGGPWSTSGVAKTLVLYGAEKVVHPECFDIHKTLATGVRVHVERGEFGS